MTERYPDILKQDGSTEPFNPKKLRSSLQRAGADAEVSDAIVSHITSELSDGDSTSTIYRHAFSLLKKESKEVPIAARYSMKRAIRELGPSGFPFEDFVAEIFKARGYSTKTGEFVKGKCANHEVDLIAEKEGECIGAEIKFHNNLGITSDLKIALYVDARFVDLRPDVIHEGWLITNTRFTKDAIGYGECRGIKMVSWSHPKEGSLQDLIEDAGVQPVTALSTLSKQEKRLLLDIGIVLCRNLAAKPEALDGIVPKDKHQEVLKESSSLCGSGKKV